jgi:hypothetical protein
MSSNRIISMSLIMTAFATNESWTPAVAVDLSIQSLTAIGATKEELFEAKVVMMEKLGM